MILLQHTYVTTDIETDIQEKYWKAGMQARILIYTITIILALAG
jgi:hypothetical protein